MGTWEQWLNGVIGAFIGAASNAITLLIIDPLKFSPTQAGGWKNLGASLLISGGVGAALYLKNHPTPFDETTKVTTTVLTETHLPTKDSKP
jgi:hypothetical protein